MINASCLTGFVMFRGFSLLAALRMIFLMLVLGSPLSVFANAGGGASGPEPLIFTVNLGVNKYLQVEMVIEPASPEAAHLIAAFKPRIQHEIILLLSEETDEVLRTKHGKTELMEKIAETVNHVIDEKEGVHEVFFTKFLIQ